MDNLYKPKKNGKTNINTYLKAGKKESMMIKKYGSFKKLTI